MTPLQVLRQGRFGMLNLDMSLWRVVRCFSSSLCNIQKTSNPAKIASAISRRSWILREHQRQKMAQPRFSWRSHFHFALFCLSNWIRNFLIFLLKSRQMMLSPVKCLAEWLNGQLGTDGKLNAIVLAGFIQNPRRWMRGIGRYQNQYVQILGLFAQRLAFAREGVDQLGIPMVAFHDFFISPFWPLPIATPTFWPCRSSLSFCWIRLSKAWYFLVRFSVQIFACISFIWEIWIWTSYLPSSERCQGQLKIV